MNNGIEEKKTQFIDSFNRKNKKISKEILEIVFSLNSWDQK